MKLMSEILEDYDGDDDYLLNGEQIVVPIHNVFPEHLEKVLEEMQTLGAPTLNAVYWEHRFFLLEGTHRINAALKLGLKPKLKLHYYNPELHAAMNVSDYYPDTQMDEIPMSELLDGSYCSTRELIFAEDQLYIENEEILVRE